MFVLVLWIRLIRTIGLLRHEHLALAAMTRPGVAIRGTERHRDPGIKLLTIPVRKRVIPRIHAVDIRDHERREQSDRPPRPQHPRDDPDLASHHPSMRVITATCSRFSTPNRTETGHSASPITPPPPSAQQPP